MPGKKVDKQELKQESVKENGVSESASLASRTSLFDLGYKRIVREAIIGYVFWSLFHALPPLIWYWPLQLLDISGYEAYCLVWFAPLIAFWKFRSFFSHRYVLAIMQIGTIVGLVSYHYGEEDPHIRLMMLSIGNGFAVMITSLTLCSPDSKVRLQTIIGLSLGYILMLGSRIWFVTMAPVWFSLNANKVIIAIYTIAVLERMLTAGGKSTEDDASASKAIKKKSRPFFLFVACGLGSLLFVLAWLFGESSVLTRWSITGMPESGPHPYPWALLTVAALSVGLYLSNYRHLATNPISWLISVAAFYACYFLNGWTSFAAGLVLAVYVGLVMPEILERASFAPLCRTFLFAILIYLVFVFGSVWTVAFNFVPGGEVARERSDVIIGAVMIGFALVTLTGNDRREQKDNPSGVLLSRRRGGGSDTTKKFRTVLCALLIFSAAGIAFRYQNQKIVMPNKWAKNEISALVWTYHFGMDNDGMPSLDQAAEVFNNSEADIIGLVESDASKPFLGNNDLGQYFAEKLGMYVDFGPATKTHTWGSLLLSRYPIVRSEHILLPSPEGELAPAIFATVNIEDQNQEVDVIVTHMGNDRDDLDRKLQAEYLAGLSHNSTNPLIMLAHVTSAPASRDYNTIVGSGGLKDIDNTDKDRWCEYIFYKKLIRLGYARIAKGVMSDTELQMAKFRLPEKINDYKDNEYITTNVAHILPRLKFTSDFGSFRSGHCDLPGNFYHMDTPKYFVSQPPPKDSPPKDKPTGPPPPSSNAKPTAEDTKKESTDKGKKDEL